MSKPYPDIVMHHPKCQGFSASVRKYVRCAGKKGPISQNCSENDKILIPLKEMSAYFSSCLDIVCVQLNRFHRFHTV